MAGVNWEEAELEVEGKTGKSGALYTFLKWEKCEVCEGRGILYTPEGDVGCYGGCEQSGYICAGPVEWLDALSDMNVLDTDKLLELASKIVAMSNYSMDRVAELAAENARLKAQAVPA